jgi:DNA-binding transcriptional regulator LsrR (DeoR family)
MATPDVMRTIRQIAEQLAMRRWTVRSLLYNGQFDRSRIGKALGISTAEVDRLLGLGPPR